MNIMTSCHLTSRGYSNIICFLSAVRVMRIEQECFIFISECEVYFPGIMCKLTSVL
jgi:hypothetical protein